MTDQRPAVLFLCVHNAGRSQMAAGWLRHLAGDRVEVYSGGSEPADQVNPAAVAAMTMTSRCPPKHSNASSPSIESRTGRRPASCPEAFVTRL